MAMNLLSSDGTVYSISVTIAVGRRIDGIMPKNSTIEAGCNVLCTSIIAILELVRMMEGISSVPCCPMKTPASSGGSEKLIAISKSFNPYPEERTMG